jgi:hypothetical protein
VDRRSGSQEHGHGAIAAGQFTKLEDPRPDQPRQTVRPQCQASRTTPVFAPCLAVRWQLLVISLTGPSRRVSGSGVTPGEVACGRLAIGIEVFGGLGSPAKMAGRQTTCLA